MNWILIVSKSSRKFLKRTSKEEAQRISAALQELSVNPYAGDIEKLEGSENNWRRRVGSYRIFYEIEIARRIINITAIKRRTSKTY